MGGIKSMICRASVYTIMLTFDISRNLRGGFELIWKIIVVKFLTLEFKTILIVLLCRSWFEKFDVVSCWVYLVIKFRISSIHEDITLMIDERMLINTIRDSIQADEMEITWVEVDSGSSPQVFVVPACLVDYQTEEYGVEQHIYDF